MAAAPAQSPLFNCLLARSSLASDSNGWPWRKSKRRSSQGLLDCDALGAVTRHHGVEIEAKDVLPNAITLIEGSSLRAVARQDSVRSDD